MRYFHPAEWILARNPNWHCYFDVGKVNGLFFATLAHLKSLIAQLIHAMAIKKLRYLHGQTEVMSL